VSVRNALDIMRRLLVDPREPDPAAIAEAADVLHRGGVVAYPTDTLYGLAVDPRSDLAVRRLFDLKERDASVAVPLIAADVSHAEQAGTFGKEERRLSAAFWPGPLTIVVPASPAMSAALSRAHGTLAVRVPGHAVARALAQAAGGCITATSANLSGHRPSVTPDEVAAALGGRIDLLLDAGPAPGGPASTIVQVVDGRLTLIRAGAVAWDRVLESLG
jgi:L-threonylcarbamoyladenylate synthase